MGKMILIGYYQNVIIFMANVALHLALGYL